MYQSKYHLTLLTVVILSCWWQSGWAYKLMTPSPNDIHYNPNIRCPGRNEEIVKRTCKYGGYIENPDPINCQDRYVCYVGLNETCHPGDKCANNAICTVCGICQKCEIAETCSDFNLCPSRQGFPIFNFIKRMLQKRLIEYGDE